MGSSSAFSYKHVYHIPSIRVSDKALSGFLNNFSIQKQAETDKFTEEEFKTIIVQPKQPTLRKRTHIHSSNVIQAIEATEQFPATKITLETVRKRARRKVVRLTTKSETARTDISRTRDSDLAKSSVTLLRRHVSLLGRYDFALLSRTSKVPLNRHDENVLRKSLSPMPVGRLLRRKSPTLRRVSRSSEKVRTSVL